MVRFDCMNLYSEILGSLMDLDTLNPALARKSLPEVVPNLPQGTWDVKANDDGSLSFYYLFQKYWRKPVVADVRIVSKARQVSQATRCGYATQAIGADKAQGAALAKSFPDSFTAQIRNGGTGAKTAEDARNNLGVPSTREVQDMLAPLLKQAAFELKEKQAATPFVAIYGTFYLLADKTGRSSGAVEARNYGDAMESDYSFSIPDGPAGRPPSLTVEKVIPLPDGFPPFVKNLGDSRHARLVIGLPYGYGPKRPPALVYAPVMPLEINCMAGEELSFRAYSEPCLKGATLASIEISCPLFGIELTFPASVDGFMGESHADISFQVPPEAEGRIELMARAVDSYGNKSRPSCAVLNVRD